MASDPIADNDSPSYDLEAVTLDSMEHRAEEVVENENQSPQDDMVHLQNGETARVKLLAVLSHVPRWQKQSHQQDPVALQDKKQYLDQTNRYRLITSLSGSLADSESADSSLDILDEQEVFVIDSQPSRPSFLEQDGIPILEAEASTTSLANEDSNAPDISVPLVDEVASTKAGGVPSLATRSGSSLPTMPLFLATDASKADLTPSLNLPLVGTTPKGSSPKTISTGTAFWRLDVNATKPPEAAQTIRTYFELQEQLYPSFPRLVDAWDNGKHNGGAVVLLENRGSLACLKDVVTQPNVVPPQILHWCHEMTELWEVLCANQCCQSLLKLDNVRIDEDHILCLRRLYFDDVPGQYALKDLGQLWQQLFSQEGVQQEPVSSHGAISGDEPISGDEAMTSQGMGSQHCCPDALIDIYQDLESAAIADLDTLRLRLEAAADQIHQNALISAPLAVDKHDFNNLSDGMEMDDMQADTSSVDEFQFEYDAAISTVDQDNQDKDWEDVQYGDPPSEIPGLSDDPTIVLPMQLHTLSNAGMTNIGIQRDHNEDFFSMDTTVRTFDLPSGRVCEAKGLYILCDGMGGHAAGEIASAAAGEALHKYFQEHWTDELPDETTVYDAVVEANRVIYEQNQADASEGARRMGTTLVMLLVQDTKAVIAHVGDSRIYRFSRRQGLEQLTIDHEVGQREIARGVAPDVAYARPDAYQLTQALGPRAQDFIRPDIQFIDMNEDSLFILGSDGLTDNDLLETYCESHIEALISTSANLDEGVYNLIELANQINGHDNITVLLVRVKLRPKLSVLHR
ncbi:MAG: serine/threonine phosphatase [Cyanobacteria bacterium P01_F01_bin.150]